MEERVKEFFLQYERANSAGDAAAIGALYADTFLFGGPKGVQVVKKEDFLKVVPKMKAYFSGMGHLETRLESVEASLLNAKCLLAKVRWRMTLRNPSGGYVEAFATYVLVRGEGDELSIVLQVDHQDLASVIRERQHAGLGGGDA